MAEPPSTADVGCRMKGDVDTDQEVDVDDEGADTKKASLHLCETCSVVCSSAAHLLRHRCNRTHKYVGCSTASYLSCHWLITLFLLCCRCTCGWTGRTKEALRVHEVYAHQGDRRHVCKECDARFTAATSLRSHMRVHVKSAGSRACRACGANFNSAQNLTRHQRHCRTLAKQADLLPGHRGRDFMCTLCLATFWSRAHVKKHVREAHTMQHAFKCPVCVASFRSQRSLNMHLKVHR